MSFLLVHLFHTSFYLQSHNCIYSSPRQDNNTIHILEQPAFQFYLITWGCFIFHFHKNKSVSFCFPRKWQETSPLKGLGEGEGYIFKGPFLVTRVSQHNTVTLRHPSGKREYNHNTNCVGLINHCHLTNWYLLVKFIIYL